MLWNREVLTDRGVTANKPEIIIKNKNEETCILIDVAIPTDRHIMKKEAEKKELKCRSPCIEMQRMWNMKCVMIRVNTGKNMNSTKGFKEKYEALRRQ